MRDRWCDGSGYDGGDCGCGASSHHRDDEDVAAHSCGGCGAYTPGAQCTEGLCPTCWREEHPAGPGPVGDDGDGWEDIIPDALADAMMAYGSIRETATGTIVLSVGSGTDIEDVRADLPDGWDAAWAGEANTRADGSSTEDIHISRTEEL